MLWNQITLGDQTSVFAPTGRSCRKMVFHPGELITAVPPPSLNMAESFGTIPGLGAVCCFILGVTDVSTQIPA